MHKQLIILAAAILLTAVSLASGVPEGFEKPENYPDPLRLEAQIKAYEWIDYVLAPARGAVVATGSSSISGWNNRIHADLAPLTIIPRGFGSSTMYDLLYFADKIVLPYKPRAILIYEGDNDISWGVAPEDIRRTFDALVEKIHQQLPDTRIYILSIKPSISWAQLWPQMEMANQLLMEASETYEFVQYVDIATPMIEGGLVQGKYLNTDDLHMNTEGYDLWKDIVQREVVVRESGRQ
jgi:lysophospholipase L1-like esterase